MNIDFIAERTLRNTSRLVNQGMWVLFLIAAALMMILRRSATARVGSLWILGIAMLAFMASFALRDLLRKIGHRNTENKLVSEVKTFLEREPAAPVQRTVKPQAAPIPSVDLTQDPIPSKPGFLPLKGGAAYAVSAGEPVVFDAIPSRESVAFKMDFHAVMEPVLAN